MYHSVVKVKNRGLEFFKIKVAFAYASTKYIASTVIFVIKSSDMLNKNTLGIKKYIQGQSEAAFHANR